MSVARFIADQRTLYRVPHAFSCRVLEVSEAWFYKWIKNPTTVRQRRRALLDEAVRQAFAASRASYGSPRVHAELTDPARPHPELLAAGGAAAAGLPTGGSAQCAGEAGEQALEQVQIPFESSDRDLDEVVGNGSAVAQASQDAVWRVSVNTVADSMRRQGLAGRKVKRNRGLTRQDRRAPKFPDLLKRDFTATGMNQRWVGDLTEIPTAEGKLFLASVLDLCSRRLLAAPTSAHPNAELACDAIRMATAVRGGAAKISGVIFHSDRGSTYTADAFTSLCAGLTIRQSMGRTGSCFDNSAAESFFSTLEWEVLSRHHFATREQARQVISSWIEQFYNPVRRHSTLAMRSPIEHENAAAVALIDEQAA